MEKHHFNDKMKMKKNQKNNFNLVYKLRAREVNVGSRYNCI